MKKLKKLKLIKCSEFNKEKFLFSLSKFKEKINDFKEKNPKNIQQQNAQNIFEEVIKDKTQKFSEEKKFKRYQYINDYFKLKKRNTISQVEKMKEIYKKNREKIRTVRAEVKKFKNERKEIRDKIRAFSVSLFIGLNVYNIWNLYNEKNIQYRLAFKRTFIYLLIPLGINYYLQLFLYKYYRKKEKEVINRNFS